MNKTEAILRSAKALDPEQKYFGSCPARLKSPGQATITIGSTGELALTENSLYAVFSPADIRRYPWDDYAVAAQSPSHGHSGWDYVIRHISDREKYNRLVWEVSHDRQVDFRIHQIEIEKLLRDELIANVEDSDTARLDDLVNQAGEYRRERDSES
jgi:hypothetical protein